MPRNNVKRDRRLQVKINANEEELYEQAAAQNGISVAEWVRRALYYAATFGVKPVAEKKAPR